MSDRPTPETDKIIPDWIQGVTKELPNFVEIARKLERERDVARELAQAFHKDQVTLLRQRDEARADLAEEMKFHHRKHAELVQTQCQLQDAIRERDEAREAFVIATDQMVVAQCKLRESNKERDEAREALADWENAAVHVKADHPDEKHCGCVSVLRKLLHDARSDRDELRGLEAMYQKVAAACLRCDPIPAFQREDDQLEPPWEVIDRIRRERDEAREERDIARLEVEEISQELANARKQIKGHDE